jgi:hypothetical protein
VKCGSTERYVKDDQCVPCAMVNQKRWREKNARAVKTYAKAYRAENTPLCTERARKWRLANPEKFKAQKKEAQQPANRTYHREVRAWRRAVMGKP